MCAKNHRSGLVPIQTCKSCHKSLFCMYNTTDEGWYPYRPVILLLITLFCMHKTTGEVWNPYRLVILVQKSRFCIQKQQMKAGIHRDLLFWSKSRCFASKTTDKDWDTQRQVILVLITLFCVHEMTGEVWNS